MCVQSLNLHQLTADVQAEAKGRDDVAPEETLCSTSAVVENVSEEISLEFLEMLVENIIKEPKSPSASFTMEIIPGTSSVVVTFESGKGICLLCVCVLCVVCVYVCNNSFKKHNLYRGCLSIECIGIIFSISLLIYSYMSEMTTGGCLKIWVWNFCRV